ncbi:MBL fold metallo-hydrolase [Streptomyces sp. NPDC001663]|uniref:MBL fold metallo-hydrolase n=1 Tax=Streptomyces sp. NPDC001663 TaxID=3364597 RepID=UPI0036888E76
MDLPVAEKWFDVSVVDDGLTWIQEPHTYFLGNIWWLRGQERDLVVDSGLGITSLRAAVPQMFENDPILVLTHSHLDHVGGAHEFATRVGHVSEAGALADPPPVSLFGAELATHMHVAPADILVPEPTPEQPRGELLLDAVPDAEYDVTAYRLEPAALTRELQGGEVIDIGDRAFDVLHFPGHTSGSIALFEKGTGVLFSGDIIYDGTLVDQLVDSDRDAYLRSFRLLRELPVEVVYAGHDAPFGRQRLHQLIDDYVDSRTRG